MAEELLQRVHGRAGIGVALREAVPERVRNDQLFGEGDRVAVPPMTSADRQSPPGSLPFRSDVTRSASRTATITSPPSATLLAASGETG